MNPPLLVPPIIREPLIIYLTINEVAMSGVLGQHDDTGRNEQAIYYINKKFTNYEAHYSITEKLYCGLTWSIKILCYYMLSYTT